jgi:hypothetical protein
MNNYLKFSISPKATKKTTNKNLGRKVLHREEAINVIEKAHFNVFDESIGSRKSRKQSLKELVARGNNNFINTHAFERYNT